MRTHWQMPAAVSAKAFPRSGEGGCERSEQTDEGAGKQQLTGNHPSSGATRPEGFSLHLTL